MTTQDLFPEVLFNPCPHSEYCWLHTSACDNGVKHEDCSNWSIMEKLAAQHREIGKYRAQCIVCGGLNITGTDKWVHLPEFADYSPNFSHVFCPACRPHANGQTANI